jgi:CoA:oxalate CoA-transferase
MTLPLIGLRVLDLSRVLSGPYCTMLLADMGAEVVKVEVPGEGDHTRGKGDPESEARGGQPVFFDLNRNKKSLTLNLKAEAGKEIFKRLAETADVLVENYRPDVMDRLGLGYTVLCQINPRLIYCGISGFGKTGPYSLWPAYDQIAQGMSGLMSVTGDRHSAPMRVGVSIADTIAGLFAAYGILLALAHRQQTGRGQEVQANLLDGLISMFTARASNFLESGVLVPPVGNHLHDLGPAGTFATQDGYLNITAWLDAAFRRLCRLSGWETYGPTAALPRRTCAPRTVMRLPTSSTLPCACGPLRSGLASFINNTFPAVRFSPCNRCSRTHRYCRTAWCLSTTIPRPGIGGCWGFRCG